MIEFVQDAFRLVVQGAILLMELIGVTIMVTTAVKSVVGVIRHDPHVRIDLAEGISLALEFKLGGEVLRTLIVRTFNELAILAAILILRAAITFLIQWEIRTEEKRLVAEDLQDGAGEATVMPAAKCWKRGGFEQAEPTAPDRAEKDAV